MTLGASWKTSASGISGGASTLLLLFAGFVTFASGAPYHIVFPGWVQALAGFVGITGGLGLAGSMASLGLSSKDSNVTGGSVVQPGVPVADAAKVARMPEPTPPLSRNVPPAPVMLPGSGKFTSASVTNAAPARPAQPTTAGPNAIRW
jgi:hypothetical protein